MVDTEGDTLRVERITDRDDSKLRVISSEVVVKTEAVETESDSLIVTDTISVYNEPTSNLSLQEGTRQSVRPILVWIFGIILALAALVYIIKRQ